jgi:hypothetical protein
MRTVSDEIRIEGLTELQRDLADRLWSMDTEEEVQAFISGLPQSLKREAYCVATMLIAHELDSVEAVSPDLQRYLRSL